MKNQQGLYWSYRFHNIVYGILILFFLVLSIFEISQMVRYREFGFDYLAFWSAGKVADTYGYQNVYNADLLYSTQIAEIRPPVFDLTTFKYWPVPYLPVFVLPFQLLSRMDFYPSYWLWVIINWVVLFVYLLYFVIKISHSTGEIKRNIITLLAIVISFPTLSNFVWGSMEVLIVIVAGEFIRNSIKGRGCLAGIWVGALVIKPQLLILIIPALLILRNFEVLKGAFISGGLLAVISLFLAGPKGLLDLVNLWMASVPGMETNAQDSMMNWRTVAVRLQVSFPDFWSWVIAGIGMVGTLLLCWLVIKPKPEFGTNSWIMGIMAVFAGTCAVTWHSHIHMAMFLFPFFIFGVLRQSISWYVIDAWVLTVPLVFIVVITLLIVTSEGISPFLLRYSNFLVAFLYLFLNLVVCVYGLKDARTKRLVI